MSGDIETNVSRPVSPVEEQKKEDGGADIVTQNAEIDQQVLKRVIRKVNDA